MFWGILLNFNQYYIFLWKVFPFRFIILEHNINFPLLRQNGCYLTWRPVLKRVLLEINWYPISPSPLQTIETYRDTHSLHWFLLDLSAWNIEVFTLPSTKREVFLRDPSSGIQDKKTMQTPITFEQRTLGLNRSCLYGLVEE